MFLNPTNCLPFRSGVPTFQSDMGCFVSDRPGPANVEIYNSQRSGYPVSVAALAICLEAYYSTERYMRGGCTYAEWFTARRALRAIRRGTYTTAPGVRLVN